MYPTPSPTASSFSGPFSPTYSEESEMSNNQDRPYLRIVEQPVPKFRFRYRSEMQGAHGSLLGRKETSKKRTYPTVELVNYDGDAIIRCSLYTADSKPIPHMHQLIAKEHSKEVLDHEMVVTERNGFRAEFKGLGIVHMSKKDLKKELIRKKEIMLLEEMKRDQDLAHLDDATLQRVFKQKMPELEKQAAKEAENMDPNKVKLCFQAFWRGPQGQVYHICDAIFSETIQNMKSAETGEVKICRMDRVAGSCLGGDEVYILVEKVCKKNIQVRFFEVDEDGMEVWSDLGQFTEHDVHHQYAIVFRTPRYRRIDITENIAVKVELVRPKDNARSESRAFTFKPTRKLANKRMHSSSSDSFSSSEGPKRLRQLGLSSGDDPMLSGSDRSANSSINSLNFPSDAITEAIKAMEVSSDPTERSTLSDFAKFLFSEECKDYLSFNESGGLVQEAQGAHSPTSNIQSPDMEIFTNLQYVDHEMEEVRQLDNLPPLLKTLFATSTPPMVYTDCATDGAPKLVRGKQKGNTESLAKAAYSRLLKLMKSRHPGRLQDMKCVIRAEEQEYGPLHAAVIHGQLKELSDLLSLIIKSNLLKLINTINHRKQTPVMVAVEENKVDCLRLLCMAKADLNQTDYKGNTALHIAAKYSRSDCMKVLLSVKPSKEIKIDLNKKNEKGETALHIAVMQKCLPCVKLLVAVGADLNAKTDTAGQTPLHLAVEFDSQDIVNCLLCQESINPGEVNFSNKTARDLINPTQKYILTLFRRFCGDDMTDGKFDEANKEGSSDDDAEDDDDDDEEEEDIDSGKHLDMNRGTDNEDDEDEFEDADDTVDYDDDDEHELEIDLAEEEEEERVKADTSVTKKKEDISAAGGSGFVGFHLLDHTIIDTVANCLDENDKWRVVCRNLNCNFLVATCSSVASPTRCLITYLEFDKKVSLTEFKDALKDLNVPEAVKALDVLIQANSGRK